MISSMRPPLGSRTALRRPRRPSPAGRCRGPSADRSRGCRGPSAAGRRTCRGGRERGQGSCRHGIPPWRGCRRRMAWLPRRRSGTTPSADAPAGCSRASRAAPRRWSPGAGRFAEARSTAPSLPGGAAARRGTRRRPRRCVARRPARRGPGALPSPPAAAVALTAGRGGGSPPGRAPRATAARSPAPALVAWRSRRERVGEGAQHRVAEAARNRGSELVSVLRGGIGLRGRRIVQSPHGLVQPGETGRRTGPVVVGDRHRSATMRRGSRCSDIRQNPPSDGRAVIETSST